jgi:hypothetical protein
MRFFEFKVLDEGYKEVYQKFSQEENPDTVKKVIDQYKDLVNRNQVQGNDRNIDWWGKQGWQRFQQFVQAKSQVKSQNQLKKRTEPGQSHVLDETDTWLIVIPLDKEASCFHGKDSDWCTTKPHRDYFERYFINNRVTLIYFLHKQTGNKWAVAAYEDGNAEFFDKRDNSLNQEEFDEQTKLNSQKYINMALGDDVTVKADKSRDDIRYTADEARIAVERFVRKNDLSMRPIVEALLIKVKNQDLLRDYLYELLIDDDDEWHKTDFDQNMQTLIATQLPRFLRYISNLTPKTMKIAIHTSPSSIRHIPNPPLEIVKLALEKDIGAAEKLINPSTDVIEYVLSINPYFIKSLEIKRLTPRAITNSLESYIRIESEDSDESVYGYLINWFLFVSAEFAHYDNRNDLFPKELFAWVEKQYGRDGAKASMRMLRNLGLKEEYADLLQKFAKKYPEIV